MKSSISIIILTYNEEKNIEQCLQSVSDVASDVFIVDSYSTDSTLEIAKKYSVKIFQHPFKNQAEQLNWALENLPIKTEWIMRLDADERVSLELKDELIRKLDKFNNDIKGLYVKRKVFFLGKWIRFGGYYPTYLLRVWRKGMAYCEERLVDEHMKLTSGKPLVLENDIFEENKKNITWWIEKHNNYASREAVEILNLEFDFLKRKKTVSSFSGSPEDKKSLIREKVYIKLPLFIRAVIYFIYRYFILLGFLDGIRGLIWHFMQGLWYRFLVDVKIYEIKMLANKKNKPIQDIANGFYDLNFVDK